MEKILTISIAAYNVEKYIRQLLDSLVIESIIDDLEILVVDDGGTDKTLEIVKEYSAKYPHSIFPVHKENGGYGSVINKSVELATGKYFKQLDGDDWFFTQNLEKFIALLKRLEVDAVYTQTNEVYERTDKIICCDRFPHLKEGVYQFSNADFQKDITMHSTTVKTQILKEMNFHITEHCFYTDVEFVNLPLPYLNSFYVCHYPIYMYRLGRDGQSVSPEGIKKHYKEHITIFWHLIDIYNSLDASEKNKRRVLMLRLRKEVVSQFKYFCMLETNMNHYKELKDFAFKLKNECPEALNEAKLYSKFVKLLCSTRFLSYPLMKLLLN